MSTKKNQKTTTPVSKTQKTTYTPVSHHIYHDGNSYRVRAVRDGNKISQNFTSKKKAFEFRKRILSA